MVVINCSAEGHTSVRKITSGDAIFITATDEPFMKVGDKYKFKNMDTIVTMVVKEPKAWWQFWKSQKVLGYEITFV
jgi:hypothetical protein